MKLVVIHGRPATGKLTVARELSRLTGGRLFHNHLAVNLALSLFEFGTPAFVQLREAVWREGFGAAFRERIPLLLFTFNAESTVPQRFVDGLVLDAASAGAALIGVELVASEASIEARLRSPERLREGKTLDAQSYRRLRQQGVFDSPRMPDPLLRLDTDRLTPAQAAGLIAAAL